MSVPQCTGHQGHGRQKSSVLGPPRRRSPRYPTKEMVTSLPVCPDWPELSLIAQVPGTEAPLPSLTTPILCPSTPPQLRAFAELWHLLGRSSGLFLQLASSKSPFKISPPWKDKSTASDYTLSTICPCPLWDGPNSPCLCSMVPSGNVFNPCMPCVISGHKASEHGLWTYCPWA